MPIDHLSLSFSQFGELMGIDHTRLIGVAVNRLTQHIDILLEPDSGADQRIVPPVDQRRQADQPAATA